MERLKICLQQPLMFKSGGEYYTGDPIWWFRGGSAMFINNVSVLSKTKILIGIKELEIKRIAVSINESYYKSFIYIEAKAEKQTGLYNIQNDDILRHQQSLGYYTEEYGLLGRTTIKREEYDDGAAIINGKVTDASKAQLRIRYLTDYNFIIAAKQSPFNSNRFNTETNDMFNKLLRDELTPEAMFDYLNLFQKYER